MGIPGGGAGGTASSAGTGGRAGGSGGDATGGTLGDSGAAGDRGGGPSGGSAGSGAGSPSIDCRGTFGEPRLVLNTLGGKLFSPALTADEKEIVYASAEIQEYLTYYHSTRASKADEFGPAEPLSELDAACAPTDDRTIDLTGDGLRAYLVCYGPDNPESYVLRIAARPALDAPFVLDEKRYGEVGPSAAVAPGELALYSSGIAPSSDPALFFERATTSEPFGAGTDIPGLEGMVVTTPDVSSDGLSLYGAIMDGIVLATRASVDDPFSALSPIVEPGDSGQWVSPTISEDCRSLYAVNLSSSEPRGVYVFER